MCGLVCMAVQMAVSAHRVPVHIFVWGRGFFRVGKAEVLPSPPLRQSPDDACLGKLQFLLCKGGVQHGCHRFSCWL